MKTINWTKPGLAIALGTTFVVALILALSFYVTPTQAQESLAASSTFYLVVEFANGTSSARAITWTAPISRIAALKLAGFEMEHDGDLVCSINGDGCPASDCFCPDNMWWQGGWNAGVWDSMYGGWPPANLLDGDVIGFHNGSSWEPPEISATRYVAIADAFEWLRPQQVITDGSYYSPFGSMGSTLEMVLAVASNSNDPDAWRREPTSPSLVNYITGTNGKAYADTGAAQAGKLAVGLAAAYDMADGGCNVCWPALSKKVTDYYDPDTGAFYTGSTAQAGIQSWAMLGMAALNQTIPVTATNALIGMANPDGGWAWSSVDWQGNVITTSDTMVTAQAIQALLATGVPTASTSIQDGLSFLKSTQNSDGGLYYSSPGPSDIDSTAYAIQALIAAGEDPITGTWRTVSGTTYSSPISYLLSVQLPDGSFPAYSPVMATQHVLPALLQRPFPLAAVQVPDCETFQIYMPIMSKND